jgi:hypothetical protein
MRVTCYYGRQVDEVRDYRKFGGCPSVQLRCGIYWQICGQLQNKFNITGAENVIKVTNKKTEHTLCIRRIEYVWNSWIYRKAVGDRPDFGCSGAFGVQGV